MRLLASSLASIVGCTSFVMGAACVRDPIDRICPDLAPGDLVVTELRGPQTGADSYGQWIEVYNATDAPIDLAGVRVVLRKLDGSGDYQFLVRDLDAAVDPGAYAVFGDTEGKDFTTYVFTSDTESDLYPSAILEVYSCERQVDTIIYRSLPALGTLSLDGKSPPDADANDDSDLGWCVDDVPPSPDEPITDLGIRGTPGEANRPCP